MKRISLRNALATLLLAVCTAPAQDVPVPEPAAAEPAVHTAVPPVRLTNIVVQTIGEERHNEELRPGLLFIDESSGKLMVSDESNPHGRFVCVCKDFPDYHNFTNTIRVNGHKIELNQAFSLQAENDILSFRFDTNSVLQILPVDVGEYARVTASYEDETHLLVSANAPADAVLQVTTNLLAPTPWTTATNAVVVESDDASTTWRVTLDDASTGVEIYRVLGSVARPAGAYAYKPIHAEQGVVIPEGQSLAIGTNTCTNLNDYATAAALAAETSARTAADSALDGTVASAERRVKALEERVEEYWCKWTSASLSSNTTYMIPTNWPARTVFCQVYCELQGVVLVFPDWTPTEPYTLHLIITKTAGGGLALQAANGGALQTLTSSSAFYRDVVFQFVPSVGWVTIYYTLGTNSHVINGAVRTSIPGSILPENEMFAPVTEPAASLLSFSPAPSPSFLSPAALQPEEEPLDTPDFDAPQDPGTDR